MREHSEDTAIKKTEASGTNSIMLYLNQIDAVNKTSHAADNATMVEETSDVCHHINLLKVCQRVR